MDEKQPSQLRQDKDADKTTCKDDRYRDWLTQQTIGIE